MGSSLQRLEILVIGLIVLIVGAVVALMVVVRPASPAVSVQTTPQPVMTSVTVQPTAPIQPTSPSRTSVPVATAKPPDQLAPIHNITLPALAAPPIVRSTWPWLLLLTGLVGGVLVRLRIRRRRMSYTNQTVGQLLTAADATTRADTIKVMQNLAAQGLLTGELAAAAGIDLAQPHKRRLVLPWMSLPQMPTIRLPRLNVPTLHVPTVRVPHLHLPRRAQRPIAIDPASSVRAPELQTSAMPAAAALASDASMPAVGLGIAPPPEPPDHALPETMLREALAAQAVVLPEIMIEPRPTTAPIAESWSAEDRALIVAHIIAEVWAEANLHSPIVALDTPNTPGDGPVAVTIDAHPDEEQPISELPERIMARRPAWRASWRHDLLEVQVHTAGTLLPVGGPLVVPIMTHGRGGKMIRCYPLAAWRHLGLYGAGAPGTLHAMLGRLLYIQPPADLALAIIDAGQITPLYREVAHLVPLPASPGTTIEQLSQVIRRGMRDVARPLVLVVVEPDDAMLTPLVELATRLAARPTTPLHLIIVQERLRDAGRELYAILPALITSGGQGNTALLPGQGAWPKPGVARLVSRRMRVEGCALTLDEAEIATLLTELRGRPSQLPPVLWDTPALTSSPDRGEGEAIGAPETALITSAVPVPMLPNDLESAPTEAPATGAEADSLALFPVDDLNELPTLADTAPVDTATDTDVQEMALDGSCAVVAQLVAPPNGPVSVKELLSLMDGDHADADPPLSSRRGALLQTTIGSGDAGAPPLPLVSSRRSELNVPQPPPALSTAPALPAPAQLPPMHEPDNGWPIGPAPLGRVALAELMTRLVATPAIVAGQPNERGVTKNRLVDLLKGTQKAQARELAEILMVWLDLAGLLVEPSQPDRLRHPRGLMTTNLAEIAAGLTATPCPDMSTVRARWAEATEGRM